VLGKTGYDRVKPGVILATEHTNNQWNDAFSKIAGVITKAGNQNSHAGTNARERGIPSLVGAGEALERLRPHDGQVVTVDTRSRTVYLGTIPIGSLEIDASLWNDLAEVERQTQRDAVHEESAERILLAREVLNWQRLQKFGNTVEDFDGRWLGQPKIPYGYFQLDTYRRGWEVVADILNRLFPESPIPPARRRSTSGAG
jgi:phosphohistidine swiveling domain-containing protein